MLEYPQLIIDKPYYKLNLIKSFFYTYELLDFDGNILDNQCTYYCEPKFTELTGDIVKIYVQTGTGRISSQTQYYDTRQALISPIYDYVLCEHGNYVAVGDLERNAVVIYDMFDNDNIISIIPLENLLITTDDPIEWASFPNNMGDIDISYRTPDGTKNIRSAILN